MNPFSLFENKNIEDIKLGLKVIKSLSLEKEFEEHFEISYRKYNDVFNNIFLVINKSPKLEHIGNWIIENNLNLSKLSGYGICDLLRYHPQLLNRFDLTKLNEFSIALLLEKQPQLVDKFELKSGVYISMLLQKRPELINNLDLTNLRETEIFGLLKKQPQLKPYFKNHILKTKNETITISL